MKRISYTRVIFIISLMGVILFSGCDKRVFLDPGYLDGTITIGPICPVETDPPSPGCLPTAETYKAWPVSIWTANGRIKIAQIEPSADGEFTAELMPGNYKVILEKDQNGVGGSNLPVVININSREKTILNINIDTGIR